MSKPRYDNDCRGCKFLTREGDYDIYFHEFDLDGASLVFVFGNKEGEYITQRLSGLLIGIDKKRKD